jgi:hypothetical protein
MWSKIYLAFLAVSLAVMAFFAVYSLSWLQSIGDPRAAAAGFEYHSAASWPVLWISSIGLLVLANAVLWTTRRAWAMWVTFVFLAGFIALKFFWLDRSFAAFQADNNLAAAAISFGPFFAAIMIVVIAAIVFFDQFFVVRMLEKMYPTQAELSDPQAEEPAE